MNLVFATNNLHKLDEARAIMQPPFSILSLKDINCNEELREDFSTLEENSLQKADFIFKKYSCDCFADDTGLEVEALGGRPGVLSARYAGTARDSLANIRKVLSELNGNSNRKARFRTSVTLILGGKEHYFEGIVKGSILHEPKGNKGFGYDPVFVPDGSDKSFSEMNEEEKNSISHRGRALIKMTDFLKRSEKQNDSPTE